jgi:LysM repeat protein
MRKFVLGFVALIWLLVLVFDVHPSTAQAGDAWALIAEVNAYRAANGLPPFEVDSSLMTAAQRHSEYMAETGTISHGGPGGSSARDRAVAAGYGSGAAVQVIENVAGGNNLSPSQAVYSMWQDDLHRQTMLTSYYTHIGAGVATSGSFVYYTIDVGRIQGAPPPATATLDPAATHAPTNTRAPTKVVAQPVVVATPRADGTIVHVVQPGQALYTIAVVYEVPLEEILALNGLTMNSVIHPGDEIIIKLGPTPTNTQPPSPSDTQPANGTAIDTQETSSVLPTHLAKTEVPSPISTSTARPTASASPPKELALAQPAETAAMDISDSAAPSATEASEGTGPDIVFLVIFILVLIGVAMVVFGGFLKRNHERDSDSEPSQEP